MSAPVQFSCWPGFISTIQITSKEPLQQIYINVIMYRGYKLAELAIGNWNDNEVNKQKKRLSLVLFLFGLSCELGGFVGNWSDPPQHPLWSLLILGANLTMFENKVFTHSPWAELRSKYPRFNPPDASPNLTTTNTTLSPPSKNNQTVTQKAQCKNEWILWLEDRVY